KSHENPSPGDPSGLRGFFCSQRSRETLRGPLAGGGPLSEATLWGSEDRAPFFRTLSFALRGLAMSTAATSDLSRSPRSSTPRRPDAPENGLVTDEPSDQAARTTSTPSMPAGDLPHAGTL